MKMLQTERLQLTVLRPADFNEVLEMFKEKDIFKFIAPAKNLSFEEHVIKLHKRVKEAEEKEGYFWAVRSKKENTFLGLLNLNRIPNTTDIQIGWVFSEKARGQGFAFEGAKVVFDYGVNDWKVNPIFAVVEEGNNASEKIALKLGLSFRHNFTEEGVKLKMFSYVSQ